MRTGFIFSFMTLSCCLLVASCTSQPISEEGKQENLHSPAADQSMPSSAETSVIYKKGDAVPSELVCMVNNEYMGRKQMEVPFEGRMYYGCCNMCVERIPTDPSVRQATDPYSKKTIDKSTAYIVLIGDRGEVVYFENEASYKALVQGS